METRDSALSWSMRYRQENTPWEVGAPHPELLDRIARGELEIAQGTRVYVPGCGRGRDALGLARAGPG